MKVTVNFDLENSESDDNINYKIFSQSLEMYSSLYEILQYLRSEIKYSEDEVKIIYLEEVRDKIVKIINDNNININY